MVIYHVHIRHTGTSRHDRLIWSYTMFVLGILVHLDMMYLNIVFVLNNIC